MRLLTGEEETWPKARDGRCKNARRRMVEITLIDEAEDEILEANT
jgi:hypothetical protein